tara:strand:- start:1261 stop:2169 length:909 start_codon:yes stop_codon:yes gene_type:complete
MQKIVIIPTHPGVNSMTWSWLISRSPDMYTIELPPHQFVDVNVGQFGSYPDIPQDIFSSSLIGKHNFGPAENLKEEIDPTTFYSPIGGMLQDLEDDGSTGIWHKEELKTIFDEFIKELKGTDIPGLVINVPTWMYSKECIQIANDYHDPDNGIEVRTLFVKSNLPIDKKQRLYLLYNGFGEENDVSESKVTLQILDTVRAESKHSKLLWSAITTVESIKSLGQVAGIFERLNLTLPDDLDNHIARITQHIDQYTSPENDVFEEGIDSLDWNQWINGLDESVLFDEQFSYNDLKLAYYNDSLD